MQDHILILWIHEWLYTLYSCFKVKWRNRGWMCLKQVFFYSCKQSKLWKAERESTSTHKFSYVDHLHRTLLGGLVFKHARAIHMTPIIPLVTGVNSNATNKNNLEQLRFQWLFRSKIDEVIFHTSTNMYRQSSLLLHWSGRNTDASTNHWTVDEAGN